MGWASHQAGGENGRSFGLWTCVTKTGNAAHLVASSHQVMTWTPFYVCPSLKVSGKGIEAEGHHLHSMAQFWASLSWNGQWT